MPSVKAADSSTSTYLKGVLDRLDDNLEERVSNAMESGRLSKRDQASLARQEKQNEQAVTKAMSDGILDRAEYQRLAKAMDVEGRTLDRMLKVKSSTKSSGASGSNRAMSDQDGTLKLIQNMQKRMHETIQKALSAGTISKAQGKALQKLEDSEQGVIDKALADGTVSKGEYTQISKAQSSLSSKLRQYQSAYRKSASSSRLNSRV